MSLKTSFASLLQSKQAKSQKMAGDVEKWKAKGEDDDRYVQGDDESDDDFAKRCKALDDEDEDGGDGGDDAGKDDKEAVKQAVKLAVAGERERCMQIVAAGIEKGNVAAAGVMAFDTDMPAKAAIKALGVMGAVGEPSTIKTALYQAMGQRKDASVGSDGEGAGKAPANADEAFLSVFLTANGMTKQA